MHVNSSGRRFQENVAKAAPKLFRHQNWKIQREAKIFPIPFSKRNFLSQPNISSVSNRIFLIFAETLRQDFYVTISKFWLHSHNFSTGLFVFLSKKFENRVIFLYFCGICLFRSSIFWHVDIQIN